jgi:methyl-accepting chemotaxis protein PixJ
MTQIPTSAPLSAQDDDTQAQPSDATGRSSLTGHSPARPVPPPAPSKIETKPAPQADRLGMTRLNYYSETESQRLRSRMQAAAQSPSAQSPSETPSGQASSIQRFSKRWANLSLRNKLAALMIVSATVPTVAVTQTLVTLNRGRAIDDAKEFTISQGGSFRDEYVLWSETDATARSSNLARLVQASSIDPSNPESVGQSQAALKALVTLDPFSDPETSMSLQVVLDIKGRSIAQDLRVLSGNQTVAEDLEAALKAVETTPVQAPLGQDLRSFPMVQQVLSSGQAASGIERISPQLVEALGLSPQLSQAGVQVSRDGYALAAVSIHPVLLNGSTRGAVIAAQILNNNNILGDAFKLRYEVSTAGVFDGDKLVLTTEPGNGGAARQTEAVVSPEAVAAVLERGEEYLEVDRQAGHTFLRYYSPIYDHSAAAGQADAQAAGQKAKPVGMTYLGQSLEDVESRFQLQQLLAYGLGGSMILLSTLLALPAAASLVRPLQRLSSFLDRMGKGDRGLRIAHGDRQDEVGQLSLNMNRMADSLESNELRLETALWQNQLFAEVANLRSLDSGAIAQELSQILEKSRKKLDLDRLVIYSCGSTAESGQALYEARLPQWPSTIERGISDRCISSQRLEQYRQGQVQVNPDMSKAGLSQPQLDLLASLKVQASILAPMVSSDALYGLLVADSCRGTRDWDNATVEFLQDLADRVAAVLSYASLVDQQRQAEESIRLDKETLQHRALELLKQVDPVSHGDLTVRAKVTEDEIGTVADSYNATIESLRKIVTQVQVVSGQVTSTAQTNDAAVQNLAKEALNQSDKVSGSLENLAAMGQSVQQLATQADEARTIMDATKVRVKAGEQAMLRTVEGMAGIQESVTETTQKMESLESASERISNVIRLISGFAAQTHMLAMKASIEAARAGDEGQGFAVIADEVRSLAAQSAQATADVETVINTIQMATQDVIAAMKVENSQVAKQMELVEETRSSLAHITAASAEVNQLVNAIAQTTQTQTQTSNATTAIITEVAELVRQTSTEANQVSKSFKQLVDVSQALQAEVAQFKVS